MANNDKAAAIGEQDAPAVPLAEIPIGNGASMLSATETVVNPSGGAPQSEPTYLSIMPTEMLENFLRLCRKRPNRVRWAFFLSPCFLRVFLEDVPGAVSSMFSGVRDGLSVDGYLSRHQAALLRLSQHQTSSVYAGYGFGHLGSLLKKVEHVEFSFSNESNAEAVVCHCSALRSLATSILRHDKLLCRILEARGKQLHKLKASFYSCENAHVIARHCTDRSGHHT